MTVTVEQLLKLPYIREQEVKNYGDHGDHQMWTDWKHGIEYVISQAKTDETFRNELRSQDQGHIHDALSSKGLHVPWYVNIEVTEGSDDGWFIGGPGVIVTNQFKFSLGSSTTVSNKPSSLDGQKGIFLPTLGKDWITWATILSQVIVTAWVDQDVEANLLNSEDAKTELRHFCLDIDPNGPAVTVTPDTRCWSLRGSGAFCDSDSPPTHYTIPIPPKPETVDSLLELWSQVGYRYVDPDKHGIEFPAMVAELPQISIPDFTTVGLPNLSVNHDGHEDTIPYHTVFEAVASTNDEMWGTGTTPESTPCP